MQTTDVRPRYNPDRAIDLACRAVRVMGEGLDAELRTFGFHPQPQIPVHVCTKTNIQSDVVAMHSPEDSTSKDLKGSIET